MAETFNFGYLYIHLWEWAALPIYLTFIFFIALWHQKKKIGANPIYRYYIWGLFAKIGASVLFALIYLYYYHGGDTIAYYESALTMKNLLFQSPIDWLQNEFGSNSPQNFSLFTSSTGYPLPYMYCDIHTFTAIRLFNILIIPAFNSFLLSSILVACFSYWGMWKMFLVFSNVYPKLEKSFAFAVLFFPSVLFWASGLLKDTITLSCTGWIVYCVYSVFIIKKSRILHGALMIINIYLILLIKPYIIIALLPGALMWIFAQRIKTIKNSAFKTIILPCIIILCVFGGYAIIERLNAYLGKFSIQKVATTAAIIQKDMHQSYYHGHGFDIGATQNTPIGYIEKSPIAITAGLFRPFIWESGNIVMLISGIENTVILVISVLMLLRNGLVRILRRFITEPLLFFSLTYSAFFAFGVGISTSNFGALVRFKVAYLPFFVAAILILLYKTSRLEPDSL